MYSYGTCWVYNDFGNKKIKKEMLRLVYIKWVE